MIVFVTGATGFIGKHLVRRLLAEGHQVRCLARSPARIRPLLEEGAEAVYGDVNDRQALLAGMQGCDWLFHLANLYSMWEPDRARFQRVNVDGTRLTLECALEYGVKKVVYVSTIAVYGQPAEIPFNEKSEPGPVLFSEYARTKAEANRTAWSLSLEKGLPLVVLYPGIVLGAGDDKASGHYIQDIIRRRVPSTIFHHSRSTYVHVADVVEAMVRAAEKPETTGQKYLVGGVVIDGREFAERIHQASGVPLPLFRFPDWLVVAVSYLLTWIANIIKRPPLWGLSIDASNTLKHGFVFDGSRVTRELGVAYTPIQCALEEAVESYRQQWKKQ